MPSARATRAAAARSRRSASVHRPAAAARVGAPRPRPWRSDSRRYGAANETVCSPNGSSSPPATSLRDLGQHLLGHPHQVLVVHVRLVELEHRELGVVLGRDPLIPEVTIDLVDAFEPADGQPLEVQLGRDAQEQVDVERVVMRDERPGQRAAGDRLHHRRLDLEEAARVQEPADAGDHARARLEHPPRLRIDDEIEVALAVARLDVGQPVPFLRQRQQALRQKARCATPRS